MMLALELPTVQLTWYLGVGGLLFLLGIICVMTRRNIVWLLIGVELVLNAASLNFVAFWRYIEPAPGYENAGMVASVIIILLAAAEAAVALAILVAIYRNFKTIQTEDLQELRN